MNKYFLLISMLPGIAYIVCALIGWYMIGKNMYDEDLREKFKRLEKAHKKMMNTEEYKS